jgi:hypothetical protein
MSCIEKNNFQVLGKKTKKSSSVLGGSPKSVDEDDFCLHKLKLEVKQLRGELTVKDKTIKNLNKRLTKLEGTRVGGGVLTPRPTFTSSLFDEQPSEADILVLARVHREMNEAKKIAANIVVSGLWAADGDTDAKKAAHDNNSVRNLVDNLGISVKSIKSHKRIKVNGKPDLVIIEFDSETNRNEALKSARKLQGDAKYNMVFINKDMTKAERTIDKRLRDERNKRNAGLTEKDAEERPRGRHKNKLFYWGIRPGELRRIFDKQVPNQIA